MQASWSAPRGGINLGSGLMRMGHAADSQIRPEGGPPAAPPMQPSRKRGRGGCLLGMIVLLLLVALAAVVVLLNPLHFNLPGPLAQLQLISTPEKTLAVFCSALQNGDYHTAYQQLSPDLQAQGSEAQFGSSFEAARKQAGPMTLCSVSNVRQRGEQVIAEITMRWERYPQALSAECDLLKINGVWKINRAVWLSLPG